METKEEYVEEQFSTEKKRGKHLIGGNGRKKGSSSKNTIKDPLLEPYYIKIDGNKSYTILKEGSAQIIGYYTTIGNTLKRIALEKVDNVEEDTERTLKQYLTEYFTKLENFSQSITI